MKRSKLNPGFIEWARPFTLDPDKSVTITKIEYADIYTTIVREASDEARSTRGDDTGMLTMLIALDIFNRLEHFLFDDDDEPNAADKTDVSDGKE